MSKCSTARTCRFRVRLTRDGRRWLDDRLAAHCRRYNAALQERRDAWRMARRSISFAYGEGYVSIYRVIRPAISVTSTASAGSRATFVVYDCNSTNGEWRMCRNRFADATWTACRETASGIYCGR